MPFLDLANSPSSAFGFGGFNCKQGGCHKNGMRKAEIPEGAPLLSEAVRTPLDAF
jgi:hypothetical protein